jgi:hypothetical protein
MLCRRDCTGGVLACGRRCGPRSEVRLRAPEMTPSGRQQEFRECSVSVGDQATWLTAVVDYSARDEFGFSANVSAVVGREK